MANVDKSLNQAPLGLGSLQSDEPEQEFEIEIAPDEGDELQEPEAEQQDEEFNANLAEDMDEGELDSVVSELLEDYQADIASRKDWINTYVEGLDLLGMQLEDKTEPWIGACSVYHPLLTEALVKFQAETIMATFPASGPVKTTIIGKQTPEKIDAAARVRDDMNYQLTEMMSEYRPEHERMLWGLGLSGNAFKKIYFDPALQRQVALYVPAEDMVVPYGASNLETSPRITHVMRKTENELRKLQVAGFYIDEDLGEPLSTLDDVEKKIAEKLGFAATQDDRYKILEMHVELDLPGYEDVDENGDPTGVALPYVVTIEKGTETCLSIRRNWDPDDARKEKRQHFVHYPYIPGFGFYAFGLIHLIGSYAKAATMLTRQLVDAGTLSNLPGGFKTRGLRIKGDDTPISPAEFRDVDVPSGSIKDNIMALPYKEPSQVLMALMQGMIQEGRQFASAADMQASDMSANSPVGTTLAILERSLKTMSAVQARIHYAMKQEFKLLAGIIRDYTPDEYDYEPEEGDRQVRGADYDTVEVVPVSDPNASTMAQKVVKYQAVMQMASQAPQMYDMKELHRQMLEVMEIKNIDLLLPGNSDKQEPVDPVTENMAMMTGKAAKAFATQDHKAHNTVHSAFAQDPKTQAMLQNDPQAQQKVGAMMAHIAEHFAFEYRVQIQQHLGVPLPDMKDKLPPDVEGALSMLVAEAAGKLLQTNTAEAQQQQAQQQAQDPLVQMQQQELQLKQGELQLKGQIETGKLQLQEQIAIADHQIAQQKLDLDRARLGQMAQDSASEVPIKQQKIDLERARIDAQTQTAQAQITSQDRVAGTKIGVEIAKHKAEQEASQRQLGTQMGIEIAKHKAQQNDAKDKAAAELVLNYEKHNRDRTASVDDKAMSYALQDAQQKHQQEMDMRSHAHTVGMAAGGAVDMHKHAVDTAVDLYKHQLDSKAAVEKHKREIKSQEKISAQQPATPSANASGSGNKGTSGKSRRGKK